MSHHDHNHDDHDDGHSRPHTPVGFIKDLTHNVSIGEEIDFVVGLTATAVAADQILKMANTKKHKTSHLVKAAASGAVATTAFTMMAREHKENKKKEEKKMHEHDHDYEEREHYYIRDRSLEEGHVESLTDSDDDEERLAIVRRSSRRGSHGSRSPPRERSASAHSHRSRKNSYPGVVKFLEVVRDSLQDRDHDRR